MNLARNYDLLVLTLREKRGKNGPFHSAPRPVCLFCFLAPKQELAESCIERAITKHGPGKEDRQRDRLEKRQAASRRNAHETPSNGKEKET